MRYLNNNFKKDQAKYRLKMSTETIKKQIEIMIVNDSPYMTKFLGDILTKNSKIRVSQTSRDGSDALRKLKSGKPDVILLDLEMPIMDGLTFIESMAQKSELIPIIVVSSYSQKNAKMVLDALEFGAVDFVPIPQDVQNNLEQFQQLLIQKIEMAEKSDPNQLVLKNLNQLKPKTKKTTRRVFSASQVVVIGSSTGGPNIVNRILSKLPEDIPAAILVVQHMPKEFTTSFAERLDAASDLIVKEAKEGDELKNGVVLVAPGDYHMMVDSNQRISLNQDPKRFGVRPAANVTMISATEVFGGNVTGVVLSGMGHDGAFGMKAVKKRGGGTIIQNKESSVVFGMAKAALELGAVDHNLSVDEIPEQIIQEVARNI